MKYLIASFIIIFSASVMSYGQNQTQLKVSEAEFTTKDKMHDYAISIKDEGVYKISVISPSGELISIPINNSKFTTGQVAKFSINSKYWTPGSYSIMVEKDKKLMERLSINVSSDRAKKERQAHQKAKLRQMKNNQ